MNSEVTNGQAAAMQAQLRRDSEQTGAAQKDHAGDDRHCGQTQLDLELEPLAGRHAAQGVQRGDLFPSAALRGAADWPALWPTQSRVPRPIDHADPRSDDELSVPASGAKLRLLTVLTAGDVSYAVVAVLCLVAFLTGRMWVDSPNAEVPNPGGKAGPPIVLVEKSALVMQAVLERPQLSRAEIEQQIAQPIREVLQRYTARGYVVVDVARDEAGGFAVAALPEGAADITPEVREALNMANATQSAAWPPAATSAASAAALTRGTPVISIQQKAGS